MRTNGIKKELNDIEKWEAKIKRKYLRYETNNYIYDFQQYGTIRSFGENIYNDKINMDEAEMDQTNLLKKWKEFKSKPRAEKDRDKKRNTLDTINAPYEG